MSMTDFSARALVPNDYDEHFVCFVGDDALFMERLPTNHCAVYARCEEEIEHCAPPMASRG